MPKPIRFIALSTGAALLLSACYQPPSVKVDDWSVKKVGGDYVLTIEMLPKVVADGGMQGALTLFYSNGCQAEASLDFSQYKAGSDEVRPQSGRRTFSVTESYTIPEVVAGARLQLQHKTESDHGNIPFFDEGKIVDPVAQKKAEKTKCKPTAPSRSAPSQSSLETAATIINMRGYLCGQVTDIYPRGGNMLVVHCTEYRDGRGKVQYLVHTDNATVERLD